MKWKKNGRFMETDFSTLKEKIMIVHWEIGLEMIDFC